MRTFKLLREEDVSGTSGTGVVAEGVEFTSGWVALTWLTPLSSMAFYHSARILESIHGHDGRTKIVWDELQPVSTVPPKKKRSKKAEAA
jgi:hypothetical protein